MLMYMVVPNASLVSAVDGFPGAEAEKSVGTPYVAPVAPMTVTVHAMVAPTRTLLGHDSTDAAVGLPNTSKGGVASATLLSAVNSN